LTNSDVNRCGYVPDDNSNLDANSKVLMLPFGRNKDNNDDDDDKVSCINLQNMLFMSQRSLHNTKHEK